MTPKKVFIFSFFLISIISETCSQVFYLEIEHHPEKVIKHQLKKKAFKDTLTLKRAIKDWSEFLQEEGYFSNRIIRIERNKNEFIAYFELGPKIDTIRIHISEADKSLIPEKFEAKNKSLIKLQPKELKLFLKNITDKLEREGKSFSAVRLENLKIEHQELRADLRIHSSSTRTIDSLVIKGYPDFPEKFIKNQFVKIGKTIYSKVELNRISNKTKTIPFITETKPPEVLFKNDSTSVFIYVTKKQNNSVDANLSFNRDNNGQALFNGLVDLQFTNLFDRGNEYALFWNAVSNQRQELKFSTRIPYIYKSKFTPNASFSIFRQDSTFINTNFNINLDYQISETIELGVNYTSISSNNLIDNSTQFNSFTTNFIGLSGSYLRVSGNSLFPRKFQTELSVLFGNRKSEATTTSGQIKMNFGLIYLWELNTKNFIFLKNETAFLNSGNYLENELFRIGGINSVRGFNDQSIFTDRYTQFTAEYRFLTSVNSYFFTITDIAKARINRKSTSLLGLGFGYQFSIQNSQIRLATALGKTDNQNFNLSDTQLLVSWKNFF